MNEFDDWDFVRNPATTIATGAPPIVIAANITSDGVSTPISLALGKAYNVYGYGVFDGATVSVEWSTEEVGAIWAPQVSGTGNNLNGVHFTSGLYVIVGQAGTVLTSADTLTWTSRTSNTANILNGVDFGGGTYLAVGNSGTIIASPDAVTAWNVETSGTSQALNSVVFGNGLFIVCGFDSTILTSPADTTWTPQTSPVAGVNFTSVTFAKGLFVMVGGDGMNNGFIITSPDGITWTLRNNPLSIPLTSVSFGGGQFLTTSFGSSPNIALSPEGITWSIVGDGVPTSNLDTSSFAFDTYLVGGGSGVLFTSPDAINWTEENSQTVEGITGITEGDDIIILVANSGDIRTNTITWTALKDADGATVQFTSQEVFFIPRIGAAVLLRTNTIASGGDTDVTVDLR